MSSKTKSPSQFKRDKFRMLIFNLKKQAKLAKNKPECLSISFGHPVSIPPTPSFSSLATPPETIIQELIPKLRNMKIEMEFTLSEVCDYRDVVDLKHEHIAVLSYIIRRIELLRPR